MQVGLMGGTFDPIHYGHLLAAESAREACNLDEVWFIPAGNPPLKSNAPKAGARERLEMVYRAIDFQPHFRALDIELDRETISYTIDTIAELKVLYPGREFSFIIGADRVNDLTKWHRIEELAQHVTFIALDRPGTPVLADSLPDFLQNSIRRCQMPQVDFSSTDIRQRVHDGRSIRFMTPDKVFQFIQRNGLYGS
ncbi:nicotinate-nucleotide adenylyltransferase [Paenibacillus sp. GCM10012307]|uniref:Probable nicotinate-nucleotide adenylyltransferase n=1 Tax=Paenibacillus roseus TaxID=2798579 RepID=A0A934JA19_9BACL|nr:nicotinate-nucleotide adenylyltransferase [Paenibacillus roseus]